MLGLGWGEVAVILVLGLFVFGPERLPRVIADTVRTFRQLRAQATSMTEDLKSEFDPHLAELRSMDPRGQFDLDLDGPPAQRTRNGIGSTAVRPTPPLAAGEVPPYDPDAT